MFVKITASGEPLERLYYLSEDNRSLRWNSNFWAFKSQKKKQSTYCYYNQLDCLPYLCILDFVVYCCLPCSLLFAMQCLCMIDFDLAFYCTYRS